MMRCIAIDDEPKALAIISHHAGKVPFLNVLKLFRSGIDALDYLSREHVDLIFIDIEMPDISGFELLQALSDPPLIIFTTAFSEFGVQSYDWNAADYLLKPIEFHRFLKAVTKAAGLLQARIDMIAQHKKDPDEILIRSGVQTYRINIIDILYLEASGNYVFIVTAEKKIMILSSLGEIQKRLPANQFVRIHKSYIVSINNISSVKSNQVKIANFTLPIGRSYHASFAERLKI